MGIEHESMGIEHGNRERMHIQMEQNRKEMYEQGDSNKEMPEQVVEYASGNEMAAFAAMQIGYDLMGYYPITPSTQIAEQLDLMRADGKTDMLMVAAEGEHSAAGICYGASVGGGRVFNATSANGLLYALEQFPVQSGTRYPMVMNVACRAISGPLSIKGDHSDIMYMLNTGWLILYAHTVQEVYDLNIIALRLAETVRLPAVVAYDGFFTSHQKRRVYRFASHETVKSYIGNKKEAYPFLDLEHPITVGSYMNEPDLIHNKYQLHQAMEQAKELLPKLMEEYQNLSGRAYEEVEAYHCEDAKTILILLGSSFDTAMEAVDELRKQGEQVGVLTLHVLRPFPAEAVVKACEQAHNLLIADRQDSYGAGGGNLSLEIRAAIQRYSPESFNEQMDSWTDKVKAQQNEGTKKSLKIRSLVYGLGGMDFYVEDAIQMFRLAQAKEGPDFAYYGVEYEKEDAEIKDRPELTHFYAPLHYDQTGTGVLHVEEENDRFIVKGGGLQETLRVPRRIAPGHGACPGCGIPVNLSLLLRAIEDPVVLLFQTGCGMIVTTPYPKTSFKVPYLHNLFQNGAATLSGLVEICHRKQERGEIPKGDIVFIMVSGDGGMDIGMGAALGTALRGHRLIIFEYDNGGYMNTGYQLSYATPKGARSATSHVGKTQFGKEFFHKDMPQIMAATNIPYVATVAESDPTDFIRKAAKAAAYAKQYGTVYIKALSACPLNWNDRPDRERDVIRAAVDCCFFPLYEVERGNTHLSYEPEQKGRKIPVIDWLAMMGRTKHLVKEEYREIVEQLQCEVDRRYERLKAMSGHPYL